ncbi:MAG TPA: transcriptional repressor LexA [Armatimonadota bacterium]|jgi:repressor LexA
MAKSITPRQKRILDYIAQHSQERGYPPTVREIGEAVGLRSSSTVHSHLKSLQRLGFIVRDAALTRAIRVPEANGSTPFRRQIEVPLVGAVAAGLPILASENIEDHYAVPYDWTGGQECFLLRVKGDSMIEDGILDGDLVLIRSQQTADDGDTVVGLIDNEATVKRLYREGNRVRLQPANHTMQPIYAEDVAILGKVVGVMRYVA